MCDEFIDSNWTLSWAVTLLTIMFVIKSKVTFKYYLSKSKKNTASEYIGFSSYYKKNTRGVPPVPVRVKLYSLENISAMMMPNTF